MKSESRPKGRGVAENPRNRFETLFYERDGWSEDDPAPTTRFLRDQSRSIISRNESPDVGFDASVNPYRGCEHGCIYCFARPNHEYLGFSAGLDFETRIMVKDDAPELLEKELSSRAWSPQVIALSGVTDPYQPIERRLGLTRRCLEVLAEFQNPTVIITKSDLVVRDADVLGQMAEWDGCAVFVSVTTLDSTLGRRLEPRAAQPGRRLRAIEQLSDSGIPTGVLAAPIIPGLTDHELPAILDAARRSGARFAGYIPLRLPHGVGQLFENWLEDNFPARKSKVMHRILEMRGGRINDPNYKTRMRGEGAHAAQMKQMFDIACRKVGLNETEPKLSAEEFRGPVSPQRSLFG